MEPIVFLAGRLLPRSEAWVPIDDATFRFGEGVFETLRARQGRAFRLTEHLARLRGSAAVLGWELPWSDAELRGAIGSTLDANGHDESRVQAGPGQAGLNAPVGPPRLLVEAVPFQELPPQLRESGVAVTVSGTRRSRSAALHRAKSCSYLESLLSRRFARAEGFFEAIWLNDAGEVCEASMANVFAVRGEVLWTPPVESGALAGITRDVVMALARLSPGVEVRVAPLQETDFRESDEVFLTSTGIGILPVVTVDARNVGEGRPGRCTLELAQAYRGELERELGPAAS